MTSINDIDKIYFLHNMNEFDYEKADLDEILNTDENHMIGKTTEQLTWAGSQTRPDIAVDALNLSMIVNRAKCRDAK